MTAKSSLIDIEALKKRVEENAFKTVYEAVTKGLGEYFESQRKRRETHMEIPKWRTLPQIVDTDEQPDDGAPVLLWSADGGVSIDRWDGLNGKWQSIDLDSPQPTHFMPMLPLPGKGTVDNAWALSRRDSKAFVDAVLNPPAPNAALQAAAARAKRGDKT